MMKKLPILVLLAGCTDSGPFSELELRSIRVKLAPVPDKAPPDASNRVADDPAAASLGKMLYFDPRYSSTGTVSCATCHDAAKGFQDARGNTSAGVAGFTGRHAPAAAYVALGQRTSPHALWEFWDGRADSQWAQALGPPENMVEMGSSRTAVALHIYDHYRAEYEAIFGPMPEMRDGAGVARFPADARPGTASWSTISPADQTAITGVYVGFGKAISAYERLLLPRGSKLDRFLAELATASDSTVFTDEEKLGLRLFLGKGACLECHEGPALSDFKFHNIALAQTGPNVPPVDRGREAAIAQVIANEFNCASAWSDVTDKTLCAVTGLVAMPTDLGAFKTPPLRDLSRSAPYMHTGSLATLEQVIDHYDRGGDPAGFSGTVDERIGPLQLTAVEKSALLAFLRTLDADPLPASLTDPPVLP